MNLKKLLKKKKPIKQNKNNVLKTLDFILIIVGIATLIFTIVMCIFFYLFQSIPDTLVERFFTCIVGELGITGLIQVVKTICNKNIQTKTINNDVSNEIEIENEIESEENIYG